MIYIAHRGLFEGPDTSLENKPEQIERAIKAGFDCEVDLRTVLNISKLDYDLFLGHDEAMYPVDYHWLSGKPLWIHAKDFGALYWLNRHRKKFNYFWHQEDSFTITSEGYIWTFPGNQLSLRSIDVVPEWHLDHKELINYDKECYGVCSKYVGLMKKVTK